MTSASPQTASVLKKFHRPDGKDGQHGVKYEIKMGAFLFARALHKTEEFYLASNLGGAGAFDDLVLRYRLKKLDIWKTCFIQLKHKKKGGKIWLSSLTRMSGDFSLFKYFESYCEIKSKAPKDRNLKQCGPFDDFEFVIYTNARMEGNYALQGKDSDPVSMLSSVKDNWQYITFDETHDKDIFVFFEELAGYHDLVRELEGTLRRGTFVDKEINEMIDSFQSPCTNREILDRLNRLKSTLNKDGVTDLIQELAKCDFTSYKEFLSKVKIFQSQSNENSLNELIEKEITDACKASPPIVNSIYTKFVEGYSKWWEQVGNVEWLRKDSNLWQNIETSLISEVNEISELELKESVGCGVRFKQQHIQSLCDTITQNTFLNIVTNSDIHNLQKLKTHQALNFIGYKNSLFIGLKSLMVRRKEIRKLWPCKWSAALIIDCDCEGNVADILLDILQETVDSAQSAVGTLVGILQKYQQKVILISTGQHTKCSASFQKKLRNIYTNFEDNCDMSDLDEESQKKILERTVNFQGINVALQSLVGTDPPECTKRLIDSDVISILLSNEHKLCVGKQLCDHAQYYIPRVLQHHVYLKEGIFKLTDNTTTFAVSGLPADELKRYLPDGEKICEFEYDEGEGNPSFKIVSEYSNIGLSDELENMKAYNNIGRKIKPEEVRYIILGNKTPESRFGELKEMCENVHWIHVEEGSFLWKDTKGNIDTIRRYIYETKCRKYYIENVMEQSDRTMLLVAEPGMGKTTFLSHMEHEIKKRNAAVWVLRINLNEHTSALDDIKFEVECIDKCKMFLWGAAHKPEKAALTMTKHIFLQALEQTGKMVIILDGFDEISPYYTQKVNTLIKAIRDKTASQIFVSSRFSHRQDLEGTVIKLAFRLQPFTLENQIEFLEKYWKKDIKSYKEGNLRVFAEELLSLCSQKFSDKDGEFTGIPLQTMMLGEAFVREAVEYCSKGELNLPEKFNLLDLFNKFWEKKCEIYFSEKNAMDSSKPKVKNEKKIYLGKHMISSLISLFSLSVENELHGAITDGDLEQANNFLQDGTAEQFGIIREMKDGQPHFIHRCFAEYFAAKWLTGNFSNCENFISNTLFKSTYEVTRNIFDRMLAGDSEIHDAILNNDIDAFEELLKKETDINFPDKGGRTPLHLAASYNSPLTQKLLSFPGVDTNKPDLVLKWTPLRYADRTKSWMAMDILLQNGANTDDIVLTRHKIEIQEWGQRALWECASQGYTQLLEFMLNCGIDVNAVVSVPENKEGKNTLLHIASDCCQLEVIRLVIERKADINIRDVNSNTALHHAAISGSVEIIEILLDKGMCVDVKNKELSTPIHLSALHDNLEATKALVERGASLDNAKIHGKTPLLLAARYGKIEVLRYLTEIGADINIRDAKGRTALHHAAISRSVEIIKILLDKGMSVDLKNAEDSTPLHISAADGNLEATKLLVESGSPSNNVNKYGMTPLLLAAHYGKIDIIRYLTEIGADINIHDTECNSALHHAVISGSVEIIKILLDKGMSVDLKNAEDSTPLHISALNGHLEATKFIVKRGAPLNNVKKYGKTPLLLAARYGKMEVFSYLTEIGADINIRDRNRNTALHHAAISGSVEIIKILLDKGMNVVLTNAKGATPLHFSALYGHLEATKALVEGGAPLNNFKKYGKIPLFLAARYGKIDVFRYLIEIGADINIRDVSSNTALHHAAISGSVEMIKILIDKGMCVDVKNKEGSTPLHLSTLHGNLEGTKALVKGGAPLNNFNMYGMTPLLFSAKSAKLEVFRYLTEIGANINIRDRKGNTALHHAAISGSVEIIKILLDKGMCVDVKNKERSTPLHLSTLHDNLEATKALVERGAPLNNTKIHGKTPLLLAARYGKIEVFRYLTEIGAEINIRDAKGRTALHLAAFSGSVEIIKILLDKGMYVDLTNPRDSTPLHISALEGNLEATKALVERGASLNSTNKNGETPLLLAARFGKLKVLHYFTEIGADINFRDVNSNTALHLAASSGSVEIIKILLDKGMFVDLTNARDSTPLHISALEGNLEATKALVGRGASLNSTNKNGETPLLLAARFGKLDVLHYFTEIGADINFRDVNSNTALHLAASWGSVESIKILLDKGMSVDLTNAEDSTPLHISACEGNLEATKTFVERGASLKRTNKDGYTPLMFAEYNGKVEVVLYLRRMGAYFDSQQRHCPSAYVDNQQKRHYPSAHVNRQHKQHCPSAHVDSQQKRHCPSAHVDSQQKRHWPSAHVGSQQKRHWPSAHVDNKQKRHCPSAHVDSQQKRHWPSAHVDNKQKRHCPSAHVDCQQKRHCPSDDVDNHQK